MGTVIHIKGPFRINRKLDQGNIYTLQEIFIMETSKKGKEVDLERCFLVTEIHMKACGKEI